MFHRKSVIIACKQVHVMLIKCQHNCKQAIFVEPFSSGTQKHTDTHTHDIHAIRCHR